MVDAELNTELIAPINAASKAAIINPTSPVGSNRTTISGYAMSPLVTFPPTTLNNFGYSPKAIIPGSTSTNTGNTFKNPAKIVPALACPSSFADSTRCTITWSVHQYQMPKIGAPRKIPVHGYDGSDIGLIM